MKQKKNPSPCDSLCFRSVLAVVKRVLILLLVCSLTKISLAQTPYTDSLKKVISTSKNDTAVFNAYDYLCYEYIHNTSEYKEGIKRSLELFALGEKLKKPRWQGAAYNYMGNAYQGLSDFNLSIEYFTKSLSYSTDKKLAADRSATYNNIAETYRLKGDYENALKYNLEALKIRESQKDTASLATSLANVGSIYHMEQNFDKALEYYFRALAMRKKLGNKIQVAMSLNNLGLVYQEKAAISIRAANTKNVSEDYNKALEYYKEAVQIVEEANSLRGKSILYNNVGNIYHLRAQSIGNKKDYDTAMIYYNKTLEIRTKLDDKQGLAMSYNNIGNILVEKNEFDKGEELLNRSLQIAEEIDYREVIKAVYHDLAFLNNKKGNFKMAFEYLSKFSQLKDSMMNHENSVNMAKMQALYDSEKKDKDLLKKDALLAKQKVTLTLEESKNKRQKIILITSLLGLLIVIGFSVILAGRLKLIRKQKHIIESQKELVEEKNKDITDSINYAKKIQSAMLPREEELKNLFPESFVFFRPRNIVSGDFYWCAERGNSLFLAVADCTGHGVPGAMMSMIGTSLLHQLVAHPEINDLSKLLHELDAEVVRSLKQQDKDSESRDGMDIAIIEIRKNTGKLFYAAANRPLLILNESGLTELHPTKVPIGGNSTEEKIFVQQQTEIKKGDRFFLFSDGYCDQFGGPKGKKLMTKNLKELLLSSKDLSIEEQGKLAVKKFTDWQGGFEQVDDVCLVGIKI